MQFTVWNGHPIAQTGVALLLSLIQAFVDLSVRKFEITSQEFAQIFQQLFFAADPGKYLYPLRGKQISYLHGRGFGMPVGSGGEL